jgi:exodeoxyribonuclease-3
LPLRIATWNVNSLRQRLDHLARFASAYGPDVVCLQETKVTDELFPTEDLAAMGFVHQLIRGQKGYNGVAILSRQPFEGHDHRVWCSRDDKRHLAARLPGGLELHNFYVPSGGPLPDPAKNDKFAHKLQFLTEMADWAHQHRRDANLLLVGDLNVAPLETDVWNHKRLLRSVGHTPVESAHIDRLLTLGGLHDVARHFVPPSEPLYTWWGYRFPQAFEKNYGWRLDHVLASSAALARIGGIEVVTETRTWSKPSDHVPVLVELA